MLRYQAHVQNPAEGRLTKTKSPHAAPHAFNTAGQKHTIAI